MSAYSPLLLLRPTLAQMATAFPRAPIPDEVKRDIVDDFIFSSDDWNRRKQKIKESGGIPVLNSFLAFFANDPKLLITPRVLAHLRRFREQKVSNFDVKSLAVLEKREEVMKMILQQMREKIKDGIFSAKEWKEIKVLIQEKKDAGGFAALNFFFWVVSRADDVKVEKSVREELGKLAEEGKMNRLVVHAFKVAPPIIETSADLVALLRQRVQEAEKEIDPQRKKALLEEVEGKLIELALVKQDLPEVFDLLAEVQMALGKYDQLTGILDDFVQRHPEHVPGFMNLAKVYRLKGEVGGAKLAYEEAIQRHPNHYPLYYEYGLLLREVGEKQKAVQVLQKFLTLGTRFGKEDPFFRTREPVARQLIKAMNQEMAAKARETEQ